MPQKNVTTKYGDLIATICSATLGVLCFTVVAGLAVGAFAFTARFDAVEYSEKMAISRRFIPMAVVGVVLMAIILLLVMRGLMHGALDETQQMRRAKRIVLAVAVITAVLGIVWTVLLNAQPRGDQNITWQLALALAKGDLAAFAERGAHYMKAYPQQYGAVLLAELMIRLFGENPVPAYGIFNSICSVAALLGLCAITVEVTEASNISSYAVVMCALLCLCFLPIVLYAPFCYATLFSIACECWGMLLAIRFAKNKVKHNVAGWLLLAVLLCIGTAAYNSTLLFTVAITLVLVAEGLFQGSKRFLQLALPAILILALVFATPGMLQHIGCMRTGLPEEAGMPKLAWVAMGIHSEEGVGGPGSYDGANWDLYNSNEQNAAATTDTAKERIAQYLEGYRVDHERLYNFFSEKTADQWLDPWFGSLVMTYSRDEGAATPVAELLTIGPLFYPVQGMLTVLLTLIYTAAAIGVVAAGYLHKKCIWQYLPAVAMLGGFLFQLVWENKSRYCLPYVMVLLPFAALGLVKLMNMVNREYGFIKSKANKTHGNDV